jgi:mono/diheme cytochrome c family protein
MLGRTATTLVFASALLGFAGGIPLHAQSAEQPTSAVESARLLVAGKEIFLERCARCHNEGGDKPLKTGAPLNERGLSTEVITQAVNGRLRDRTEDECRAVTLYISSLMKSKNPGNNAVPKP